MGGDLTQTEPTQHDKLKENGELWEISQRGNFTTYIEALNGHDTILSREFTDTWKVGVVC